MIESGGYTPFVAVEGDPDNLFEKAWPKFCDVLISNGFDPRYGRRSGVVLRAHELTAVSFEGRTFEWGGYRLGTGIFLYIFQLFRNKVVGDGLLSASEADEYIALLEKPSFCAVGPIIFSSWGQRPTS